MQELDDNALLREFVERESEEAFSVLVARHVNKVYSIAFRLTRNPHQAEEVTQAVFIILARKARTLGPRVILSGWICRTAHFTSITFNRSEIRRARREEEAHMQTPLTEAEGDAWLQIAPCLDDAMAELSSKDHLALVLRFFDAKSMKELGAAMGTSEDAAKQRVSRALERLRQLLCKRGVAVPLMLLGSAMSAASVQAVPAALPHTAAAVALAAGTAAGPSVMAVADSTVRLMHWLQMKTSLLLGAAALYAGRISMRELTLLETGCLCAGLVLSLILPLMMSSRAPKDSASRISCLRIVWLGQAALAAAGLVVLFSEPAAVIATVLGAAACITCAFRLRRHLGPRHAP